MFLWSDRGIVRMRCVPLPMFLSFKMMSDRRPHRQHVVSTDNTVQHLKPHSIKKHLCEVYHEVVSQTEKKQPTQSDNMIKKQLTRNCTSRHKKNPRAHHQRFTSALLFDSLGRGSRAQLLKVQAMQMTRKPRCSTSTSAVVRHGKFAGT